MLVKQFGSEINGLNIYHDHLTIEHLISEADIKRGSDEDVVGNIGNLVLIDGRTNSEQLADKDPVEKIKLLTEIGYPVKAALIAGDHWSAAEVRSRAKTMAKKLFDSVIIR